jgi:diketogulonate reductase-like aldo/keto reductase
VSFRLIRVVWVFTPDTAQAYRNEEEAGQAIHESGLAREDIFVTTKYSAVDGLDIQTSIHESLKKVSM